MVVRVLLDMSTSVSSVRATFDTNWNSFIFFFHVMQNINFEEGLLRLLVDLKDFLFWVRTSPNEPRSELIKVVSRKADNGNSC